MTSARTPAALHRLAPVAGVALLMGAGLMHRTQTAALRDPAVLAAAAERLAAAPRSFDGWTAESLDLTDAQLRMAEATGGFARRYVGPDGEGPIEVMLLTGPQGPISVHPPTVCFRGAGYRQCSPVGAVSAADLSPAAAPGSDEAAAFAAASFEKEIDGRPFRIRTYWGWGTGAGWDAPDMPRVAFAGEPFLYKLYVTEFRPADAETVDPDAADADAAGPGDPLPATKSFLNAFLPRLSAVLADDADSPAPPAARGA